MELNNKISREAALEESNIIVAEREQKNKRTDQAKQVGLYFLALFGLVILTYIAFSLALPNVRRITVIGFIAFSTIVISVVLILTNFEKKLNLALDMMKDAGDAHNIRMQNELKDTIENSRTMLPNPEEVVLSATALLRAHQLNSEPNEYEAHKLVYLGAPSISTLPAELLDEDNNGTLDYIDAQNFLINKGVMIERYIALIPPEIFWLRGEKFKKNYLSWLVKEEAHLRQNQNYWFFDAPRAFRWGALSSYIFGKNIGLEVFGGAQAGAQMNGEISVRQNLRHFLDHINAGESGKKRMTAKDLEEYRHKLENGAIHLATPAILPKIKREKISA